MRLKQMSKTSLNSSKNSNLNDDNKNGINFNILNSDINNVDENSFDLDMENGEVILTFLKTRFILWVGQGAHSFKDS